MDELLIHLFFGVMELFGVVGEGASERKLAIAFFAFVSAFCLVAGCLLTGWASTLLFVLGGLSAIVLSLIVCRVRN